MCENAYYVQKADQLFPIFGVTSLDEARRYVPPEDHHRIIESSERVLMNPATGSVDFESGWDDDQIDYLLEARFDAEKETWVEVQS